MKKTSQVTRKTKAKAAARGGKNANRSRLLQQREEILNLYQHDLRVGQEASDEGSEDIVDRANNSYNREFMFALSDAERQILRAIDSALDRLDDGSYGVCQNCDEEIPKVRLKAVPWAGYCIDCQELAEQGAIPEV